jgi:hypothetical protein
VSLCICRNGQCLKLISSLREIAAQLEAIFNLDKEDEPDRDRDHRENMSILKKMNMWSRKAGQGYSILPYKDFFEGVKDDEEDPIDQSELSTYHKSILNSPAYEWFLRNLAKESILNLDTTTQLRILQQILDKLPTGPISKRRPPDIYQVIFNLEWQYTMEERLRLELSEESKYLECSFRKLIVVTGSP